MKISLDETSYLVKIVLGLSWVNTFFLVACEKHESFGKKITIFCI